MVAIVGGVLGLTLVVCFFSLLWQHRRSRKVRRRHEETMPNHGAAELLASIQEQASFPCVDTGGGVESTDGSGRSRGGPGTNR